MEYVDSYSILGINTRQNPCIVGSGVPTRTTEGKVGCLYMDKDTGEIYKCVSEVDGVVWESIGESTLDEAKAYADAVLESAKSYIDETILGGAW